MEHEHEWVVFSTALQEGWLMLQCVTCGKHGTIDDPTKEEWSRAFYAPAKPYRWLDASRVTIRPRDFVSFYVVPRQEGANCEADCPHRQEVGEYERVPAEIIWPIHKFTDVEQRDLAEWADFVKDKTDMCSFFFPLFINSFQAETGNESSGVIRQIARRIEAIDRKGLHFRPAIVAFVLREFARINS